MSYCPRCGENTNLGTGPNIVAERRQPLRVPLGSNIVKLPLVDDGSAVYYGGMRFRVVREADQLLLWAIE